MATVIAVDFYKPQNVPYPLEKTKHILRKIVPTDDAGEEESDPDQFDVDALGFDPDDF